MPKGKKKDIAEVEQVKSDAVAQKDACATATYAIMTASEVADEYDAFKCDCLTAVFERKDLTGQKFEGLNLQGITFIDCNLTDAEFKGCDLRFSAFHKCTVDGMEINDCKVSGAIF